ncbi:MAG: 4-hydroxythreonine-4-phosphate dehydrogenase PdxA [Candidatus Pelagibacter sp.]
MKYKPLLIVLGEPYSTFSEIIFKFFRSNKKSKNPILFIGSSKLLEKQMLKLNYDIEIKVIDRDKVGKIYLSPKKINVINVNFNFKKIFDKISDNSYNYIKQCFDISLSLLKSRKCIALINGPISKKNFLKKKYLGITEYLTKKTKTNKSAMLIYNPNFSVSPITTHLPVNKISKNITKKIIIKNVLLLNNFYRHYLNKKAKIAILGLNPHCETINDFSEEDKIIKPTVKILAKKKLIIDGPYPADTFFNKRNIKKYNLVIGMYHDQVLTPMKTIFGFDAINITLGLPFIRVSPDHGTNNAMIGTNKSNADSFTSIINFFNKFHGH